MNVKLKHLPVRAVPAFRTSAVASTFSPSPLPTLVEGSMATRRATPSDLRYLGQNVLYRILGTIDFTPGGLR